MPSCMQIPGKYEGSKGDNTYIHLNSVEDRRVPQKDFPIHISPLRLQTDSRSNRFLGLKLELDIIRFFFSAQLYKAL